MATSNYHHGDLRAAAVATGLRMLGERSADALGLRELARELGVSATALYRHFPNKTALLSALAAEGVEALAKAQRQANKKAGGGENGFTAMGIAYVEFAISNPALFRLMSRHAADIDLLEGDIDTVGSAMRGLRETVAGLTPAAMSGRSRTAVALRAWSLVHGLACLILDGKIEYDAAMVRKVLSSRSVLND